MRREVRPESEEAKVAGTNWIAVSFANVGDTEGTIVLRKLGEETTHTFEAHNLEQWAESGEPVSDEMAEVLNHFHTAWLQVNGEVCIYSGPDVHGAWITQ